MPISAPDRPTSITFINIKWEKMTATQKEAFRRLCSSLEKQNIITYCRDLPRHKYNDRLIFGWKSIIYRASLVLKRRISERALKYWHEVVPLPFVQGKDRMHRKGIYMSALTKWLKERTK